MTSKTGDRFIPNRARFDPWQSRASLLSPHVEEEANIAPEDRLPEEYKRQLRRTLFGQETPPSLLGFCSSSSSSSSFSTSARSTSSFESPFTQDILRSTDSAPVPSSTVRQTRSISTVPTFVADAPMVLQDDDLNLISVGPRVAVALDDSVYLMKSEGTEAIKFPDDQLVTSLKWSPEASLAMGTNQEVNVWDVNARETVAKLYNHDGYVTALEWRAPNELLAASDSGIQRYDLRLRFPEIMSYESFYESSQVSSLQWHDQTLVAAAGDTACLWDLRHSREPWRRFQTRNIKSAQVCNRNVLVTGGVDGVHFWNVQSGKLRGVIQTPEPVTNILWSPYRQQEFVASYGDRLGVWSVSNGTKRLADWSTGEGKVLSLDYLSGDGRVISLQGGEAVMGWKVFEKPVAAPKKCSLPNGVGLGMLELPVIR